jgi:hypothetical protein
LIVEALKQGLPEPPPVIVGGKLVDLKPDVAAQTGADLATNDLEEALEFCGLTHMPVVRASRVAGG